jgi:hypothetical protein
MKSVWKPLGRWGSVFSEWGVIGLILSQIGGERISAPNFLEMVLFHD